MGGGGKGGSTTVNKVEIPPEVLARYNAVNARAETVAQQPYQEYSKDPNAFVAPLTQTQQAGIQNTNAMAGAAQPYYGAATGLAAASTGNVNPQDLNVNQYMNPFTQNVVNATQAALQQQQGQQLSQQQSDAIRGGAFGGERAGLQRAQLMGQQGLATAQAISPLYQQNYNQALAAAQQQQGVNLGAQQANRQNLQNAATLFGSIGTNAQQAGLAGAQAQLQAGQGEQQTQQAGLQALYNQFQQKQGYPFQVAQFLANIAEGTGALSGNTTTQTTTGGGGFFSDKRLKENVQKVGKTNDGQPIYRFNYKGDPRTQIGLMAQDVEKSHPEAVGLAGGYKTVDYKKATDDAVHSRRHFSGEEGSFVAPPADAYSMTGSPSAMLSGLSLPKMTDGANIHIQPGAINPAAAGLLAPEATGYSRGTREGKQAEADSLRSSLASGYGSGIGSGPDYMNKRLAQLDDFLAQNSSQGGLVGAGGGSFARGGLAFGGVPDYTNPALAYYGPQQGQGGGLYGAQLQPGGQHQMMQGAQIQKQPERNASQELSQTMSLSKNAADLWGMRPDMLRSAEDVANRKLAADAVVAKNKLLIDKASKLDDEEDDGEDDGNARGGLIGHRQHHSTGSYVNAKGGLYGGGDSFMGPVLEDQTQQPQYHLMKGGEMQRQPQQQGAFGEISKGISTAKGLGKGADWAADKLGLSAAPEASTGALEAATAPTGGVIDLTTAAAPEAIAGAAPEALSAGLVAPIVEEGAPSILALLGLPFGLAHGGAVPHRRHHFLGGGFESGKSEVLPADPAFDPNFDEMPAAEPPVRGARAVAPAPGLGAAPLPKPVQVGDNELTVVPPASIPDNAGNRLPTKIPKIVQTREPAQKPFIPSLEGLGAAAKDTLSSENFWVPALTGIGAMLASPNKTLAGAIGSGLVGGTGAYTQLQKQNADLMKQRFGLAKDMFKGPIEGEDGKLYWRYVPSGQLMPQEEYQRLYSSFIGGAEKPAKTAAPSGNSTVGLARSTLSEEKPAPVQGATSGTTTVVPTPPTPPAEPSPTSAKTEEQPSQARANESAGEEVALKDKAQIKNDLLATPGVWSKAPPERNPILLRQQAATAASQIEELRKKAARIAQTMPENTTEATRLTTLANQLDANRKEYIDRSDAILNEAAELEYDRQKKLSEARTAQEAGRGQVPTIPDVKLPEGKTVAQAENDPDYLGARIESNMKKYDELKKKGSLEEANKYLAAADKDRDRLEKVVGTEHTTAYGTKYSVHPNADVFNVTPPKEMPKDYKSNVDPNTGIVISKPISDFIGYPETGGHPVDPSLIGKKVIIKGEGDKRLASSKAQSDALEKDFIGGAEKAQDGIDTIMKFSTAAKVLQSKGLNMSKAEMSNFARGLGLETVANQIMSAKDEAAAFTALKTNVDQAINQVTGSFARPTQAEFLITEKKATPSLDMPVDSSHSLAQTRLAGLMWQNAIVSDWEKAKRETGATNFAAFKDVWQRAHPKALFEEAADRALGNFKGQGLPKPENFTEGVVYVMPTNAVSTAIGKKLIEKGLRPGDLFVMNGVNHEAKDIGEPTRVSPQDAYKTHIRAPALTYGAR